MGKVCISLAAAGVVAILLAACSGMINGPDSKPVTDRFAILLKEVNVEQTASPYYHFTYDDSGYVQRISFNEDMYVYHYYYKCGRIDSVTSSATDARYFLYKYAGQRVNRVLQYDDVGLKMAILIDYDDRGRVTNMDWLPARATPDEKHTVFTYHADGNLASMSNSYPASSQVTEVAFEAFDTGKAVDNFGVYKGFLEHLVLLPGVRFFTNNPTRVKETNGIDVRTSQLTYRYHEKLPIEKRSATEVTAGPATGNRYTGLTTYSYY